MCSEIAFYCALLLLQKIHLFGLFVSRKIMIQKCVQFHVGYCFLQEQNSIEKQHMMCIISVFKYITCVCFNDVIYAENMQFSSIAPITTPNS